MAWPKKIRPADVLDKFVPLLESPEPEMRNLAAVGLMAWTNIFWTEHNMAGRDRLLSLMMGNGLPKSLLLDRPIDDNRVTHPKIIEWVKKNHCFRGPMIYDLPEIQRDMPSYLKSENSDVRNLAAEIFIALEPHCTYGWTRRTADTWTMPLPQHVDMEADKTMLKAVAMGLVNSPHVTAWARSMKREGLGLDKSELSSLAPSPF